MSLLLLFLLVFTGLASAQISKVSGLVIAKEDGLPVVGASVSIDGSSMTTMTDFDGRFTLKDVPESAKTLTISFIGMKSVKVSITPEVTVQMKRQNKTLEYGKNKVIAGYSTTHFKMSDENDITDFTGFTLGYSRMFGISNDKPFYLEAGALFQYYINKYEWDEDYKEKSKYAKINVPISLVYVYNIGTSGFSISPKAGINASFNILFKNECNDYEYGEFEVIDWFDIPGIDTKRFTYGWHLGTDLAYKNYILGFTYSADINKFCQITESADSEIYNIGWHVKTATLNITFAYRF